MKRFRHYLAVAGVLLVAASVYAGCSAAPAVPPAVDIPFQPIATVREVMNSVIDPSIDEVWNSVQTVVDDKGMTDHAPVSDEQWAAVRRHALVVSEAANLLLMRDRPIAHPGEPSSAPGVELPPEEIRSLIDENPDAWSSYVLQLQDSMKLALAAIDKKDTQALFDAGEQIDTTCENCHGVFWYPDAGAPAPNAAASAR